MDIGTIAVIASVLVLAYQGRELAKHSRVANELASVETNRELLAMFGSVHRVFIDHPELRPLFFDESPGTPTEQDRIRLRVVAEMVADACQVGLETVERLSAYERYADAWREYVGSTIAQSSTLRAFARENGAGWPRLAAMVAAYDAAHPTARVEAPTAAAEAGSAGGAATGEEPMTTTAK